MASIMIKVIGLLMLVGGILFLGGMFQIIAIILGVIILLFG